MTSYRNLLKEFKETVAEREAAGYIMPVRDEIEHEAVITSLKAKAAVVSKDNMVAKAEMLEEMYIDLRDLVRDQPDYNLTVSSITSAHYFLKTITSFTMNVLTVGECSSEMHLVHDYTHILQVAKKRAFRIMMSEDTSYTIEYIFDEYVEEAAFKVLSLMKIGLRSAVKEIN